MQTIGLPNHRFRNARKHGNSYAPELGKKKAYTALLQCRTFLCQKKWGPHRGKISVVDMVIPGFHSVLVSTTDLERFLLRPEKFPKIFSFGGGRVRFFLLCQNNLALLLLRVGKGKKAQKRPVSLA